MTTGNDPAQPNPADNQPQLDPNAGTPPAAGADPNRLTFTDPQPAEDLDDAELTAAKQAAEAEGAAGTGEGEGTVQGGAAPPAAAGGEAPQDSAKTGQPQPQGQPQPEAVMIPKARFDEVNGRAQQAEQSAAYWRGVAEARAAAQQPWQPGPGGQPQPQPAQPTPEQRLASIHAAQDDLATKFDNGEITMAEFKKQERELNGQEMTLREEMLIQRVQPAAQAPDGNQSLYLDTLTANLEQEHPWVQVFDQVGTDADWSYLKAQAIDNLTQRGVDPRTGDIGRYELRKEIAVLADQLGPTLVGNRAKAKGIALPGDQPQGGTPGQPQPPQLSPQAQQRQRKLEMAAGSPPNLRSMGTDAPDPSGLPSDSRIEDMSDDEIGNMPDSVRRRMMGISPA
jgi:hypothetical protein